ncbi:MULTISPECIES: nicotinate-nucleotide--dimethylbenzimidazole phosphoribosyltransferase [Myroides]|uniref:Nicotinate-nucleotide--dimethylbenzimidazole phosphoribosyltransferase n=1 Tax=Myroides albus TaxID=2562892 RepID=A0A6I3LGW5_9FLAO|nr:MULTISPECIES: nicotinate-nucleotide--dimethylbenzimidazole phosphoribosyltransferase [Myroides]MTG97738.1 nicotinate-nucleotide--dimethylbenzimidazole phosphoribosyltransferase [Myroides albus]MVX34908.1 nicotinate-nucleotide--dimethylbenzimidazole phosphoribosyltransferase [Myroides sp. LoEW2-1]UVD78713.1 nicotinate-nucleotide--dimethylbenzimidazole phosphoribosyltransferase [Myroides albus]
MTFDQQLQQKIDLKTKPIRALGTLEDLAFQIAKVQQTLTPQLHHPTILVYAADHGLAKEGVSAYPQEVTPQMVYNFLQGGAAINVFCNQNNIALKIVDAGVNADFPVHENLISSKAGYGTANMLNHKAMTEEQLTYCFTAAEKHIESLVSSKCNIVGFGEMGIGNTSAASLIMSSLLDIPIAECTGRGTGVDDLNFLRKQQILQQVHANHPNLKTPREILQTFGGFEIAQMCGAMLAAHKNNMLLMIDGFICSSAFLVAYHINPAILNNAIFCHQSDEQGHRILLERIGARAILNLSLRLGEGTGCALSYPIIQSAVNFLNNMASFESANVSNK